MDEIRVWQVGTDDQLVDVETCRLSKEDRIEQWIVNDVSVLEPSGSKLLVIGQQVQTDYGKKIDLLCMNSEGDLCVVELKRDKTPREVTAQVLDYASWVKELGSERILSIAIEHFHDEEKFRTKFEETFEGADFPETFNTAHSLKVVASDIDDSTERIVRYLSESGIDINVVRFRIFRTPDSKELLIRTFTVPPDEAEQHIRQSGRTRKATRTIEVRLEKTTNPVLRDFVTARLAAGQTTSKSRGSLTFQVGGKIRWYLRPRSEYGYVIQKGRFQGDENKWKAGLSTAEISHRNGAKDLGIRLITSADFDLFRKIAENPALQWQNNSSGIEEGDED